MTQEEIQERNKQIALMLGWKETSAHKRDQYGYYQPVVGYSTPYRNTLDTQAVEYQFDKNAFATGDLQFHSDWNWLMEAIQFLQNHFESKEWTWTSIERYPLYTDIETVFVLVSDFAKHYNEGKL
jgi:hypothetical protein